MRLNETALAQLRDAYAEAFARNPTPPIPLKQVPSEEERSRGYTWIAQWREKKIGEVIARMKESK